MSRMKKAVGEEVVGEPILRQTENWREWFLCVLWGQIVPDLIANYLPFCATIAGSAVIVLLREKSTWLLVLLLLLTVTVTFAIASTCRVPSLPGKTKTSRCAFFGAVILISGFLLAPEARPELSSKDPEALQKDLQRIKHLHLKTGITQGTLRDVAVKYCELMFSESLKISGEIFVPEKRSGKTLLNTSIALCFGNRSPSIISQREFDVSPDALRQNAGVAGAAYLQGKAIRVPDVCQVDLNAEYVFRIYDDNVDKEYPIKSLAVVPIFAGKLKSVPIGVLCLSSPQANAFSDADMIELSRFVEEHLSSMLDELSW
jgi:hypothetical protein